MNWRRLMPLGVLQPPRAAARRSTACSACHRKGGEVLGADPNCSGSGSGGGGVQVMPMKWMFLRREPAQKTALGRFWAGPLASRPAAQMAHILSGPQNAPAAFATASGGHPIEGRRRARHGPNDRAAASSGSAHRLDIALRQRPLMIGVDRIRQQSSGSRETGEHCRSSTMPPVCASAWRRSAPRGSVHRKQGRSSMLRTVSAEVLIVLPLMNCHPNACRSRCAGRMIRSMSSPTGKIHSPAWRWLSGVDRAVMRLRNEHHFFLSSFLHGNASLQALLRAQAFAFLLRWLSCRTTR
jgi:hypothetical protein